MAQKIKASCIITAHANADFDALAAMIAASRLYPEAMLIFPGSQEKNLQNFFVDSAMYLFNFENVKNVDLKSVKTLVLVDTRQKSRIPHVLPCLENPGLEIHVYDHHPEREDDLPYSRGIVKPIGATASVLSLELKKKNIDLSMEEATFIGLGLYEDTGSFTFNSVCEEDFEAARWLLSQGMDVTTISDLTTRELSAEQISLLGHMLTNAKTHVIQGVTVVITEVTTDHYVTDFAFLVHKLVKMENIDTLFVAGRMHDRIHLIARCRTKEVNVGVICSSFGGGGHGAAASATIKDKTLAQVKDEVFALLLGHIKPKYKVTDLMSGPVVLVEREMTMAEGAEILSRFDFKACPVVDMATGQFMGVLERKVAERALKHHLAEANVTDYMLQAKNVYTISPTENLYQVMEIILGRNQHLVPVIEDNHIIGVLTRTDLINTLIEEPARIPDMLKPGRLKERNISSLMKNRITKELYTLLEQAGHLGAEQGINVYAVGGFVRDILLDVPNLDLDLVVEGESRLFAEALAKKLGGKVRSHPRFQTAMVILPDGQRIDIATARLEYYAYPAALPVVELSSVKMDLYRRDFTINALAVQINPDKFGRLIDFFGSQQDIKNRAIRVLHTLSMVEDPTRILRAIRFAKRYDFEIGPQTMKLIKNAVNLGLINRLSGHRLFNELSLIFQEENVVPCLLHMQKLHVLAAIDPVLALGQNTRAFLDALAGVLKWYNLLYLEEKISHWLVFFTVITYDVENNAISTLCKRLQLTKRQTDNFYELRTLLRQALYKFKHWKKNKGKTSALCTFLDTLPLEGILILMAQCDKEHERRIVSHYLTHLRDMKPEISGKDLRTLGLRTSPVYGQILKDIRAAMLDGKAPGKEEQLALAKKLIKKV